MKRFRFAWMSLLLLTEPLAAFSSPALSAGLQREPNDQSRSVLFFDITDLPARIDEPKLRTVEDGYALNCAIANRSSDQVLGLRLILMIVEPGGKLRSRMTWNEESPIAPYSIKIFEFHPVIKVKLHSADNLFLAVDEVTGRETIWHVAEADKALRTFSRGQHDVMPKVRSVANKADSGPQARVIPEEQK